MKRLLLCAALASAVPGRAFDGAGAAKRVGALFPAGTGVVLLQALDRPAPEPRPELQTTIFPAGLWETLAAPDPATLAWLALRDPGLAKDKVREITFEKADPVIGAAAARGLTGLDVFSDSGLRGSDVFYLSGETLSRLFQKYDLRALTVSSGLDVHGKPFRMEGVLAGGGKVVMLYDRDKFHFANPYYTDFHYQGDSAIVYTILGPGDLAIEGLKVDGYGLVHPKITRVRKTSAGRMHVDTSLMGQDKPLWPVKIRPASDVRP